MLSAEDSFGIVTQVSSDWIYHGTTETRGEPTVGINLEWHPNRHWFVGLEAHEARTSAERQRERSIMGYLGFGWQAAPDWYATISLQQREFPGSTKEWDLTEVEVELSHQGGFSLAVDYSPDYYEHNTTAVATELKYRHRFGQQRTLYGTVGALEFGRRGLPDYRYAQVGGTVSWGSTSLDLSYGWNSADGDTRFGREAIRSPELLLQLAFRLR